MWGALGIGGSEPVSEPFEPVEPVEQLSQLRLLRLLGLLGLLRLLRLSRLSWQLNQMYGLRQWRRRGRLWGRRDTLIT